MYTYEICASPGTQARQIGLLDLISKERMPDDKQIRIYSQLLIIRDKATGDVDFAGTFHRIWDNHLAELVECPRCGRKFFPDRIEKHEGACIGLGINIKHKSRSRK